jgi:hypothetical protein
LSEKSYLLGATPCPDLFRAYMSMRLRLSRQSVMVVICSILLRNSAVRLSTSSYLYYCLARLSRLRRMGITNLISSLPNRHFLVSSPLAKAMAQTVESRLDRVKDLAITGAADIAPLINENKWEEGVNEIQHISSEFPFIDRIFLADTKGATLAYYPPSPENVGKDFSFRDWYKGVSATWEPYASEVFKRAPHPQFNTVAMVVPIKSDGNPVGILGLAINLDMFYELSQEFESGTEAFLYIVNQKGQIVAHPKYPSQGQIIDYASVPVVRKILAKESGVGVFYNPIEKENRLSAFQYVSGYNWGVIIAEPITTAFPARDATLRFIYSP